MPLHSPLFGKFHLSFALTGVLLSLSLAALAEKLPEAPQAIEGTTRVDAEGLISLMEKIADLTLIDSRIPGDRKQGFIEGSLSLPDVETTCDSLAKVISAKNAPTLFYCNGVKCGRSVNAIRVALKCGYNNIYWFRGGFEEWLAKGYPYLQE